MEETFSKLRNRFPTLPQDVLKKIDNCRLERIKAFTCLSLPEDIRWLIEAKVRLAGSTISSYLLETIQRRKGAQQSQESDGKRPCLPVYKKTRWEANPRLIEGV